MFQPSFFRPIYLAAIMAVIAASWLPDNGLRAQAPKQGQDTWASQALIDKFDAVQKLIKPQPGESGWMEIPWQNSLWTAREMAAKEGKPIFLWFGSGGSPACHT
jgi:hypothetical protein